MNARWARTLGVLVVATTAAIALLALPGSASAATTCHFYQQFPTDTGAARNFVNVCAAPASDYPSYQGWGRLISKYNVTQGDCEPTLFPADGGIAYPAGGANGGTSSIPRACDAIGYLFTPQYVYRYNRWIPNAGVPGTAPEGQLTLHITLPELTRAYIVPVAGPYTFAWTQQVGWMAVLDNQAAYRWYAN